MIVSTQEDKWVRIWRTNPGQKNKWAAFRGGVLVAVGSSYADLMTKVNSRDRSLTIRNMAAAHPFIAPYKPRKQRPRK